METVFREAEVDFMKFQSILEKNSSLNNDIAVRVMEANTYDHFLDFCREIEGTCFIIIIISKHKILIFLMKLLLLSSSWSR